MQRSLAHRFHPGTNGDGAVIISFANIHECRISNRESDPCRRCWWCWNWELVDNEEVPHSAASADGVELRMLSAPSRLEEGLQP
jgi:hypothetical protein